MRNKENENLIITRIFWCAFENHLNEIESKRDRIKNANQANQVNATFGLKIPFIQKEMETLLDKKEIIEGVNSIIALEKEIKCCDLKGNIF